MDQTSKPLPGQVSIRGKVYDTVALRVRRFRDAHPSWSLTTDMLACYDQVVRMRSVIADESGRVVAVGHSEEYRKASDINKTSAVENAETSAWGRALAALGYGGTEVATADEIDKARRTASAQAEEPHKLADSILADLKASLDEADSLDQLRARTKKALAVTHQCGDTDAHAVIRDYAAKCAAKLQEVVA